MGPGPGDASAWDAGREVEGHEVIGPWATELSEHLGEHVQLLEALRPERAIDVAPVTLLSDASISRLEEEMCVAGLGSARFRMTLNLTGLKPHEEDSWLGQTITIGGCRLRVSGAVPRCVAVTHDENTGKPDHPVLRGIVSSRRQTTDPDGTVVVAPFGVYASVAQMGTIRVGDTCETNRRPSTSATDDDQRRVV